MTRHPTLRKTFWFAARILVVGATAFFVAKALVTNWPAIRAGWRPPAAGAIVAAGGVLIVSYFLLYVTSLVLLRRLGFALSLRSGLRPFFYTLLGRYIPGRFAVMVGKAYLYERRGIDRVVAALAPAYENILAAVGGVAAAVIAAAALFPGRFGWWQLGGALVAAAVLFTFVQRRGLTKSLGWMIRKIMRGRGDIPALSPGPAAAFAIFYAIYCVWLGTFFAFLARAFVPLDATTAFPVGAAFVVAAVLGFVVVVAPSGLGVREGLLLVLLAPYMAAGDAAFLAVASRLGTLAAELILAAAAAALGDNKAAVVK